LRLLGSLIDRAGFRGSLVHKQSIFIDSFFIYQLLLS
jgi:hypothetical protein